jgi:hypothetical protein
MNPQFSQRYASWALSPPFHWFEYSVVAALQKATVLSPLEVAFTLPRPSLTSLTQVCLAGALAEKKARP